VNLLPAHALQGAIPLTGHNDMVCPTSNLAGDNNLWVTNATTAITTNMYAGGYVDTSVYATGQTPAQYPWRLRIKNHVAATATGNLQIFTYDPLPTGTLALTTTFTLSRNKYDNPIISVATNPTACPIGVSLVNIPVSTDTVDQYFWCQTWGPALCLTAGTAVIGELATLVGTAGAIGPNATGTIINPPVGTVIRVGATTAYSLINLMLAP